MSTNIAFYIACATVMPAMTICYWIGRRGERRREEQRRAEAFNANLDAWIMGRG